jgi:uncharacterized protein with PIN domain
MNVDEARLCFAGDLAELVTCANDAGCLKYPVGRRASIKDVAEALGVPHTEIYGIEGCGRACDFSLLLEPGMRVTFLPASLVSRSPVDVTRPTRLRPRPLGTLRFLVDENVAGLVPLLRALGFDTIHDRTWDDAHIARMAADQERVVLTRDRALLKRSAVSHGRLIRSQNVDRQLLEVLGLFRTGPLDAAFMRCLRCNALTRAVDKEAVLNRLEPLTREHYDSFRLCPGCGGIYWRGSHYDRLVARFAALGVVVER